MMLVSAKHSENRAIEIHDSVLASINKNGDRVEISLGPAYVHQSPSVPGVDSGTGWVQDITLVVEGGTIEGRISQFPCDLTDGTLTVDERVSPNLLQLPLDQTGKISLALQPMWSREPIIFRGSRIFAVMTGEPEYVEDVK
jgi:hypothetical protein